MPKSKSIWFHHAVTLCLLFAISISSSMVALAKTDKSLAGELIVSGRSENGERPFALLNGERAFSGRTFFSSGVFETSENAAVIKLGKLGYLELSPNSVLELSFTENSISGKLSAGDVKVFNSENVTVNIEKPVSDPAQQQTGSGSSIGNKVWIPVVILAGIVAIAAAVSLSGDDDVASPVR